MLLKICFIVTQGTMYVCIHGSKLDFICVGDFEVFEKESEFNQEMNFMLVHNMVNYMLLYVIFYVTSVKHNAINLLNLISISFKVLYRMRNSHHSFINLKYS